jgi:hypothetical protein
LVLPRAVEVVLALAAAAGLLGLLARRPTRSWAIGAGALSIVLAAMAGILVGGGGRLVTAGSVGANIGGGAALLFGFPLAGLLAGCAVVLAVRSASRPTTPSAPAG